MIARSAGMSGSRGSGPEPTALLSGQEDFATRQGGTFAAGWSLVALAARWLGSIGTVLAQDAVQLDPDMFKVLVENDRVRAIDDPVPARVNFHARTRAAVP